MMRGGELANTEARSVNGEMSNEQGQGWGELASEAREEAVELEDICEVEVANEQTDECRADLQMRRGEVLSEIRNPALGKMREGWGDFERSRSLFAEDTDMTPYDYNVIAQNFTWEEFADFGDKMHELGKRSPEEYQDLMFDISQKMTNPSDGKDFLADPRSLGLAVRRYNTIKHFGELDAGAKFYATVGNGTACSYLMMGNLHGHRITLACDDVKTMGGFDVKAMVRGAEEVVLVMGQEILQSDSFDPDGLQPSLRVDAVTGVEAILTKSVLAQWQLEEAKMKNRVEKTKNIPTLRVQEWVEGKRETDWRQLERDFMDLHARTQGLKINRKAIRERVAVNVDKIEGDELKDLRQKIEVDPEDGAREAVEYFRILLGLKPVKVKWGTEDRDTVGQAGRSFSRGEGGLITLDMKKNKKPGKILHTIAHEMWHLHQYDVEDRWINNEFEEESEEAKIAEAYAFNRISYESASGNASGADEFMYGHQLVEMEAEHFAKQAMKKMKGKIGVWGKIRGLRRK